MNKWIGWMKKGLVVMILGILCPLYVFANVQSLTDYTKRMGLSALSFSVLGQVMGANALIMWWKVLGAIPRSSLIPGMGQNWIAINETAQSYKWGGCSLVHDSYEELRPFTLAKGFARCTEVSNTMINITFSGLTEEQQQLAQDMRLQLPYGAYGPQEYDETAYALLTNIETMGPSHSKGVMDKVCAKAYLGFTSERLRCFAMLELAQTLEEVTPKNEKERRAVAVKVGALAWFDALDDKELGYRQLSSLKLIEDGQSRSGALRVASLYVRAYQWHSVSSRSEQTASRFPVEVLSRAWKAGDLEELNRFLRSHKKRVMAEKYWNEALQGR